MKRILVIYKSKYGSTGEYALNIANKLNADVIEMGQWNKKIVEGYDIFIFACPIYAGSLSMAKAIESEITLLKSKKVVFFTVGITPPEDKEFYQMLMTKHFSKDWIEHMKVFHLRGKIKYKELKWMDKKIMGMMRHMIAKKPESDRTTQDKAILNTYGEVLDFMDLSSTDAIVSYIKEI